jgi:hypothetical protein
MTWSARRPPLSWQRCRASPFEASPYPFQAFLPSSYASFYLSFARSIPASRVKIDELSSPDPILYCSALSTLLD